MKFYRKLVYLFVVLCFSSAVAAQATTCAPIVQQALSAVQQDCSAAARNQACYGYVSLYATPRDGVQNFTFSKDGDLANVADIDTLRLSDLDLANNTWGIALMKLQANLPNTLPGQNVTVLLFGDVQVQNVVTSGVQVTPGAKVNIRSTPSTDGAIIGTISGGEATTANGRNADGSWLRIHIPDSDALGWVLASLLKPSGDASTLSVVDSTQEQTSYTPMQAFYFQTGLNQTSCAQAPQDGILVQTPAGVGKIDLLANDVDIELGSTAFLQAQPSGKMTVTVVEGDVHVTADGATVDVVAGTQTTIPMNANLRADGVPSDPQPYEVSLVQSLPVQVLPLAITIASPLVVEATPETTATPGGGATAGGIGGAYTVAKVMNLGGETLSGNVCAVDQPFTVSMDVRRFSFDISFAPSSAAGGSWSYQYSIPGAGETDTATGTYTVSDAAADGTRRVVMDGTITSKFNQGGTTAPLHYEIGLKPGASCSGG